MSSGHSLLPQEYFNCSCVEVYNDTNNQANVAPANVREFDVPDIGGDDEPRGRYYNPAYEAQTGLCEPDCQKLMPFLALLLLVVFVSSTEQMPALMTLLM